MRGLQEQRRCEKQIEAEERERRAAQVLAEAEAEAERIALEKKRKKQERCVTIPQSLSKISVKSRKISVKYR